MKDTTAHIVEVCPRDGLQNERRVVATEDKIALIHRLIAAGARRIEATGFVHPGRVPQMADAEAVLAGIGPHPGVALIGLVLNRRGVERAVATGALDEVNYVVPLTDSFGKANQGQTTAESLAALPVVRSMAADAGLRTTVTVAVAYGCPYEGDVPVARLREAVRAIADTGPDEVAVADTIGCAVPADVTSRLRAVREVCALPLRTHFHQTRLTALGNVHAAMLEGVTVHDASAGGIGGCPFAPGAGGNAATEDLAWLLHRGGHTTGVDVDAVTRAGRWICDVLGVPPRSAMAHAGPFPTSHPPRGPG
ncbi:hydroxymethylglutaryl-CoA lyase [Thermomonospora umbrina]|uniref:Hydroxymethylglutaryl-CoA lyase n=1 Tax=Thermomonospora umbrina TaxID=111806 RepID=A0A3D9SQ67_9ACTN|nr:hydroxymethylglutaryl-CoA lyase [Thermomonospora umbrina]REE95085.1 hydroxymethylglutaryl-CoA lyase [Thermomonospora umbrina]